MSDFRSTVRAILVDRASLDEHIEEFFDEVLDDIEAAHQESSLRARMNTLAGEFDAKGRRGSAHFGADIGDTIRLWIERDPRLEADQ